MFNRNAPEKTVRNFIDEKHKQLMYLQALRRTDTIRKLTLGSFEKYTIKSNSKSSFDFGGLSTAAAAADCCSAAGGCCSAAAAAAK